LQEQERVCDLAHASWIDEYRSRPGNDLGTFIGEPEENAGWDLLRELRELFQLEKITPQTHPQASEALHAADGSDWFWWYGDDQTCDNEPEFDDLFRCHLRCAYTLVGLEPPPELEQSIVPRSVVWSFVDQKRSISPRDRLRFKAGCPGSLIWSVNDWKDAHETILDASGGVMAGLNTYTTTLGPFNDGVRSIAFLFKCRCQPICHCAPEDLWCDERRYESHHATIGKKAVTPCFRRAWPSLIITWCWKVKIPIISYLKCSQFFCQFDMVLAWSWTGDRQASIIQRQTGE
jgi:hypothetical protein